MKKIRLLPLIMAICILLSSCSGVTEIKNALDNSQTTTHTVQTNETYNGKAYTIINDNIPEFTKSDYTTESFEYYSDLDSLGRCQVAYACIGQDIMPTEKRGSIGSVKPSGWQTVKYDFVDGNYLYNRCHLIGYQLSAENANEKNLITGTRYLNVVGMLGFEDEVAEYVKTTNNHVLYRVTPDFRNDELVCRGVQMEAYSVEDNGKGVSYNVYCYNVQPDVEINYATGDSHRISTSIEHADDSIKQTFIVNASTKKFHMQGCPSVEDIAKENKKAYIGYRESLINNGFTPCGRCKP